MNILFNYNLEAIITLIIGLAICLYGFKLKKIAVVLIWFSFGYYIANYIITSFNIVLTEEYAFAVPIIAGSILGLIGLSLVKKGLYIAAGFLGYLFITNLNMFDTTMCIILGIVLGVIVIFLASKFLKPVIIFSTAIGGASLAIKACKILIIGPTAKIFTIAFIILAIIGVVIQFDRNN